MPPEELVNQPLHMPDLHFEVEKRLVSVTSENFLECRGKHLPRGAACLQLAERMPADGELMKPGIVTDDDLPVAGGAQIELETIGAVIERQIKGRYRIFRRVLAGAPMTEQ